MRVPCTTAVLGSLRLLVVAAFALVPLIGSAAAIECADYGTYTIKIYNNNPDHKIFPVLATPTNGADEWLQSAFQVPKTDLGKRGYGHAFVYRIYIKPMVGLAPNESVTLTLPICSQLVAGANGEVKDEYIDWWNGGRVHIFDYPVSQPGAPPTLTKDFNADQPNVVTPLANTPLPSCTGCPLANPPIYRSPVALAANDPEQLTEFTLAAIDKTDTFYKIVPNLPIVDYDISYVDHAYLPVAMGPVGNPDIGYIGTVMSIPQFDTHMYEFVINNTGWPRYRDPITQLPYLRLPGAYNAFAQWNPREQKIIEKPGEAIEKMTKQWLACTKQAQPGAMCDDIRQIDVFFKANYTRYYKMWQNGECTPPGGLQPDPPLDELMKHVYGWVPFNEHCKAGAAANDLQTMPNFKQTHATYIGLQYSKPLGKFNPYVNLIHGTAYLNMPGSYAFSIDDDVGNMLVGGTGVIITVGGPNGLENFIQYDPKQIVHVNLGDPKPIKRPAWSQFGFCDGKPARDIKSLDVQIISVKYPCTVALSDAIGRQFIFTISGPPYPAKTPKSHLPITSCTAPTQAWCDSLFGYTEIINGPPGVLNVIIAEAPPPVQ